MNAASLYVVIGDKPEMVYGCALQDGTRCLALFTGYEEASFWGVAMGYENTDILSMPPDGAIKLLERFRDKSGYSRVCLNPSLRHVKHRSFGEAIEWVRRQGVRS